MENGWVGAVVFATDGKTVVANTPSGLQFYDPETGQRLAGRPTLKDRAYGLAYSADGKLLVAARDQSVRVYDAVKGDRLHEFPLNPEQIGRANAVALSPDGKYLAAALRWFMTPPRGLSTWQRIGG